MTDYNEIIMRNFREKLQYIKLMNSLMSYAWKRAMERGIEDSSIRLKFMVNYVLSRLSLRPTENFEYSILERSIVIDTSDVVYRNTLRLKNSGAIINILYVSDSGFTRGGADREIFEGLTVVIRQSPFALNYNYEPRFRMSVMVALLIMFLSGENIGVAEDRIYKFLCRILMTYHPYTHNHSVANLLLMERLDEVLKSGGLYDNRRKIDLNYNRMRYACLLHDFGKVYWPIRVIDATGRDPLISTYMRLHPILGCMTIYFFLNEYLPPELLGRIIAVILWHHEKFDRADIYPDNREVQDLFRDFHRRFMVMNRRDGADPDGMPFDYSNDYYNKFIGEVINYHPVLGRCTCEICWMRLCDSLSSMITTREYQLTKFIDESIKEFVDMDEYCPQLRELMHRALLGYSSGNAIYEKCPRQGFVG